MFKIRVVHEVTKQAYIHDKVTEEDIKWIRTNPNLQITIIKDYNKS